MTDIVKFICAQIEYDDVGVYLKVRAIVDNMVRIRRQTNLEPEEWGPATCETELDLSDYQGDLVVNEDSILELIDNNGCEWKICEGEE